MPQLTDDEPPGLTPKTEKLVAKRNAIARELVQGLDGKRDEEFERRFNGGEPYVYTAARYDEELRVRGRAARQ